MRFVLCLLLLLVPADYAREQEAWRAQRAANLRKPEGWLTVAGLLWLQEGENRFGSDPSNDLVFPGRVPARLGVARVEGGRVTVSVDPSADVRLQGEPVTEVALVADETVLTCGPVSWFLIERGGRPAFRVRDQEAKTLREFRGLDWFPVDPAWRVEARLEPGERKVKVPTILGTTEEATSPGVLVFEVGGRPGRLVTVEEGDQLFVIFADRTNGRETYGSGRFLYAAKPDAGGRTVLDFNRATCPPCAYTPYASCPLPPPGNRLDLEVRAGEKTPPGH